MKNHFRRNLWKINFDSFLALYKKWNGQIPSRLEGVPVKEYIWFNQQKVAYKKNKLNTYKIEIFKAENISLDSSSIEKLKWDEKFREVEEELKNYGILRSSIDGVHSKLYDWFYRQKIALKNNKLNNSRKKKLESLSLDLELNKSSANRKSFHDRLKDYNRFINQNKFYPRISTKASKDESSLAKWFFKQKHRYSKGILNNNFLEDFEKLLSTRPEKTRYRNTPEEIEKLLPLLSDHFNGNKLMPYKDKEGNRNKIRVWFDNQLQNFRNDKLNPKILKQFEKYKINIEKIDRDKREGLSRSRVNAMSDEEIISDLKDLFEKVSNGTLIYKTKYRNMFYNTKKKYYRKNKKIQELLDEIEQLNRLLSGKNLDPSLILQEILDLVIAGEPISKHKNMSSYYSRVKNYDKQSPEIQCILDKILLFKNL